MGVRCFRQSVYGRVFVSRRRSGKGKGGGESSLCRIFSLFLFPLSLARLSVNYLPTIRLGNFNTTINHTPLLDLTSSRWSDISLSPLPFPPPPRSLPFSNATYPRSPSPPRLPSPPTPLSLALQLGSSVSQLQPPLPSTSFFARSFVPCYISFFLFSFLVYTHTTPLYIHPTSHASYLHLLPRTRSSSRSQTTSLTVSLRIVSVLPAPPRFLLPTPSSSRSATFHASFPFSPPFVTDRTSSEGREMRR